MDSTVRTSEKYRWWGYVLSRQEILQVRFCLCIVLIVHWIFMNPIRNPAIKFFRAKVVFEIIDSNNSTNIAEINNSFVVIDSHLSTRVSKKRARMLFHYRTLMRGKKNTLRRIFVKGGKKKKHNPTAFFTSRSLNDSFFASFHSVFFLPPALLFQYTT